MVTQAYWKGSRKTARSWGFFSLSRPPPPFFFNFSVGCWASGACGSERQGHGRAQQKAQSSGMVWYGNWEHGLFLSGDQKLLAALSPMLLTPAAPLLPVWGCATARDSTLNAQLYI